MQAQEDRRYCPDCDTYVLARRRAPNHVLHLLITICTAGAWAFVWLLVSLPTGRFRCPNCGQKAEAPDSWTNELALACLALVIVVTMVAAYQFLRP